MLNTVLVISFIFVRLYADCSYKLCCFFVLQLLCQYEPNSVLHFLETCESYRVDHCLRLCQEYKIIDAAAFLLERVGDVGSALSYTLSDLADKFSMLDAASADYAGADHFMKKEVCHSFLTHFL